MRALRAALSLLTRLPLPPLADFSARDAIQGAAWYPAVGLLIGGLLAGLSAALAASGLSAGICAVLVVTAGVLLTGGLHEDGLADACDGLFGGWTLQRRLEIMRDSRLGSYGALALLLLIALRLAALQALPMASWPLALVVAHGLSRLLGLLLLASHPYARADSGSVAAEIIDGVGARQALVGALTVLPLLVLAPGAALRGLAVVVLLGAGWAALCRRSVGGVTGDLVGGGIALGEVGVMVVLSAG